MKKTVILSFFLVSMLFTMTSCLEEAGLSEDEIVEGLKKALSVGTDSACATLHQEDGYYGNKIVKILMPPQADVITDFIGAGVLGNAAEVVLKNKMEDVSLSMNRVAESAAKDAGPIFLNAIKSMSIADGVKILKGQNLSSNGSRTDQFDSLAATHFMEASTRKALFELYHPKINDALDKDLGIGFSTNQAWNTLTTAYNVYTLLNPGEAKPIGNVDLASFAANKGLDGLFYFVGEQEKQIRKDPYKWAVDIIRKVFGSVAG